MHTLNGTAIATGALVAILENNQEQDDATVAPEALRPSAGKDRIATAGAA